MEYNYLGPRLANSIMVSFPPAPTKGSVPNVLTIIIPVPTSRQNGTSVECVSTLC